MLHGCQRLPTSHVSAPSKLLLLHVLDFLPVSISILQRASTHRRCPRVPTYKNGHNPMYMAARFLGLMACWISSSTCPSTPSGMLSSGSRPLTFLLILSTTLCGFS